LMVNSLGLQPFTPTAFKALSRDSQERLIEAGQFNRWGKDVGEAITTLHTILGDSGFQQLAQKKPIQGDFLRTAIEGGQAALTKLSSQATTNLATAQQLSRLKDEDRLQFGVNQWM